MKAVGAQPDLASYNALLRACSRAGDFERAQDVMKRLQGDGLHPNDTSWREMLRITAKMGRSDLAESIWQVALGYQGNNKKRRTATDTVIAWKPSIESFGELVSTYLREARNSKDDLRKQQGFYKKVVLMYKDVLTISERRKVDKDALHQNPRVMLRILDAIVALEKSVEEKHKTVLHYLGKSISVLDCFQDLPLQALESRSHKSLRIARGWV
jgi:pentatricopeptide repeat protein